MAGTKKRSTATKRHTKTVSNLVAENVSNRAVGPITEPSKSTAKKPASPVAARKVFGIPELLEAILFHLPVLDLLRMQQVNSTFKATIDRSVDIQQKLFYKPRSDHKGDEVTLNPFMLQVLDRYGIGCSIYSYLQDGMAFMRKTVPDSLRVCGTDRIKLDISLRHERPLPLTLFRETYKDMQLADFPIDISIRDGFINGFIYGDIKSTTTLRELIEIVRHRVRRPRRVGCR